MSARLPASFAAWCFLPEWGVVKVHVSVDDGEISDVVLDKHDRRTLHVEPSEDERRRMDDAASDALACMAACLASGADMRTAEEAVEQATIRVADAAEHRWHARSIHPEDRGAPEWHEYA